MSKESELREQIEDMKQDMEGLHEVNNDFFNENEILKARCETLERIIVKHSITFASHEIVEPLPNSEWYVMGDGEPIVIAPVSDASTAIVK